MPPKISLPKTGRALSFKKLGTDPVLVLHSSDSGAYGKIYVSVKLVSLLLLLGSAFMLKMSFFGKGNLPRQVGDGALLAFAALLSVLSVWVAVPVACICVLLIVFRDNRRLALIRS